MKFWTWTIRQPVGRELEWEDMPQVENPDLEAVRRLAQELSLHMHFHEVAIADPFEAERYVLDAGRRLTELVGWPKGTRIYSMPEQANDEEGRE